MKYNWEKIEREYMLSDIKSTTLFLKRKGIPLNGNTKQKTRGWREKKELLENKKSAKTIEKVIEKEAEQEAKQIVNLKSIANELALNVLQASKESNLFMDSQGEVKTGLVNKSGLKQLTSALKDLNDIIGIKKEDDKELSKVEELLNKIKEEASK